MDDWVKGAAGSYVGLGGLRLFKHPPVVNLRAPAA